MYGSIWMKKNEHRLKKGRESRQKGFEKEYPATGKEGQETRK